jgi:hypothetical protein
LRAQPGLDRIRLGCREHRLGVDIKRRQHVGENRGIVDAASVRELGAEERAAKLFAPCLIESDERHARRQQTVLGKRIWTAEGEPKVRA